MAQRLQCTPSSDPLCDPAHEISNPKGMISICVMSVNASMNQMRNEWEKWCSIFEKAAITEYIFDKG
jgi:hypothetical protein